MFAEEEPSVTVAFVQMVTTTDRRDLAESIARQLVEKKLAACVQIAGPIRSIYRWQGAVEEADEWQCSIKTRATLVDEIIRCIRAVHSYQVPEIVVLPITSGNPDYLKWLENETAPSV